MTEEYKDLNNAVEVNSYSAYKTVVKGGEVASFGGLGILLSNTILMIIDRIWPAFTTDIDLRTNISALSIVLVSCSLSMLYNWAQNKDKTELIEFLDNAQDVTKTIKSEEDK